MDTTIGKLVYEAIMLMLGGPVAYLILLFTSIF